MITPPADRLDPSNCGVDERDILGLRDRGSVSLTPNAKRLIT